MSDSGFREYLHELDITEDEVEHILIELNDGNPLRANVPSKRTESGFALHNRTPIQAMYFLKNQLEERRGLSEEQATEKTFDILLKMKDMRDNKGVDAFRASLGLMTSEESGDFVNKVRSGEYNRHDNLYEFRKASKTVLDGINEKFYGLSYELDQKSEFQQRSEQLQKMMDNTLKSYNDEVKSYHAKLDAENEMAKIRVQALKIRISIRDKSLENQDKIRKKGKELSEKLDRITSKSLSIKNKVQAKKVERFWKSDEGKVRRDNIVMQAALLSLHTRRALGQTNRKKITEKDLQIGRRVFQEYHKKGTLSKATAFTDIHKARHMAAFVVAKEKGLDPKKRKTPSLKRIYSDMHGSKMTAEDVIKSASLDDSNLAIDDKLRARVNQKLSGLKNKPVQESGNVRRLKVTNEGIQKLRSRMNQKTQKAKFVKITDPANQELKDETNVNIKKLNDVINKMQVEGKGFFEKIIERREKIKEAREKHAEMEKRKEEALAKRAAEEERLKQELGPEAYEKKMQERQDESLKQEQKQDQKKDSDDLW